MKCAIMLDVKLRHITVHLSHVQI